jgi:predicted transcriptional regulator
MHNPLKQKKVAGNKMTNELVSTVLLSEKRKNALLILMNGAATIEEIKESLTGTTSAIMAQIKILFEQGLIEQNDGKYRLTYIGQILMKKIHPLISTLDVLEENKNYWVNRDLSSVPDSLLDRIGEVGKVIIHEPDLSHLFEPPKELLLSLEKTKNVFTLYSYFCPSCPNNYSKLAKKEVNFDMILTKSVYDRLKEEYTEQYNAMMTSKNSNLFICDDNIIKLGALSITDDLVNIAFFNKQGIFDHKKMISFDENARIWGTDLFLYYKEMSHKVEKCPT